MRTLATGLLVLGALAALGAPAAAQNVTATTTSTPSSSSNPSVFGQSITLAVILTTTNGQRVDAGMVTFLDGTTQIGNSVPVRFGLATMSISTLAVGTHSITASYSGTATLAASTSASALSQVVEQDASDTVVTASVNPAATNQAVTYTATVKAKSPGSGTPTGTVAFTDNGAPLGTVVSLTNGKATVMATYATAGSHNIVAVYSGDASFDAGTSPTFVETVKAPGTMAVVISSSANPSVFGQSITLTASVSGATSGTVTFSDGNATLGTGTIDASGQATYTTSALSVATHNITGQYTTTTSAVFQQVVDKDAAQLALASNINPSPLNQAVTFTATVSAGAPGSGTPTQTVTFLDNGTPISAPVTLVAGVATIQTTYSAAGNHTITANYSGDTSFTKTSQQLLQVVSASALLPTTTTLVASANPVNLGDSVTFTATVTAPSGTPTGMVLFNDGNAPLGSGTLDGSGNATMTTTTLAVGTHAITAVYGGDSADSGSTSAALQQVVNGSGAPADMGTGAPGDMASGSTTSPPDLGTSHPSGKHGGCSFGGSSAGEGMSLALFCVIGLLGLRLSRRRTS